MAAGLRSDPLGELTAPTDPLTVSNWIYWKKGMERGRGRVGKEEERIRRGREEGDLKGKTGTGKRGDGRKEKMGRKKGDRPPQLISTSRRLVGVV